MPGSLGTVRRQESGFFVINLDRRIYEIDKEMPRMTEAKEISANCDELFCGIPVLSWKFLLDK